MKWLGLLIFSCTSALCAFVEQKIDPKHPLEVSLSKTTHNRIAIVDGAIDKVFADSSYFSVTIDPLTGCAFISVLKEIKESPLAITIVSASGSVQDLLVLSKEGASEQILLIDSQEEEKLLLPQVSSLTTVDLLNQILQGKIPSGHGRAESQEEDLIILPSPLVATLQKVFLGPFEKIVLYEIENTGSEKIYLSSDALKKNSSSWAFLNRLELSPGEKALLLLGSCKDG